MFGSDDDGDITKWPDWIVESYWELLDTAAQTHQDPEKAEEYQERAQECETELQQRWAGK